MENRLRTRISAMFHGSFGSSCRDRNLSDVIEKSLFLPHQQHSAHSHGHQSISPVSPPKSRPFPTLCRATCPGTVATQVINHCTIKAHRRRYPDAGGFPQPASLTRSYYAKKQRKNKKNKKQSTTATATQKRERNHLLTCSSNDSAYYGARNYWFSSDEEGKGYIEDNDDDDESDTLFFSSRSFSSDFSVLCNERTLSDSCRGKGVNAYSIAIANGCDQVGVLELEGKVKGSFAVVKSSSDPYGDFRNSMVEMIVEKELFVAKDLEQLLQCFLALNSEIHHKFIVEAFVDIWGTLFFLDVGL